MDDLEFGRDLTVLARRGELDPVVGRESEMERLLEVLSRRTKSNPLLVGAPGIGKTALVDGLAQQIVAGQVPPRLRGRRVFELQLGALLAGTQFRGELEKRVHLFLRQTQTDGTLVFIDEIHLLIQAGRGSGLDAGNLLKPVLARGGISCIGATTPTEARALFRADPAFERRFQVIPIEEPDEASLRIMLLSVAQRLERFHGFPIRSEAIEAALKISAESVDTGEFRKNPDRAIDLLEEACAALHLQLSREQTVRPQSTALLELQNEIASASLALDLSRHVSARIAYDEAKATEEITTAVGSFSTFGLEAEHVRAAAKKMRSTSFESHGVKTR